jgi:acyl carrier protein
MELDKIIHIISNMAAEVFERPGIQLKLTDSASNIKGWDSLTQVILVAVIEKQFDVKFSYKDLASIITVGDIVDIIKSKTKENPENET